MTLRIRCLQHAPAEGPGAIAGWTEARGHHLASTHAYRGDPLPSTDDLDLLVVLGGAMGVHDTERFPWLADEKRLIGRAISEGKAVLGICLGSQLVADVLGARVHRAPEMEIGWFPVERTAEAARSPLFAGVPARMDAFHWHGDTFDLPAGAVHLARSAACEHQAFAYGDRVLALQFHLEMTPRIASALVRTDAEDLSCGGAYVQTAEEIISAEARFAAARPVLHAVLDRLIA